MNNLSDNQINILHLPNEVLFKIFKKLNMIDVFYSLAEVNQRFNLLVLDSLYVRDLAMTSMTTNHALCDQTSSIDTLVLSTVCEKIVPQIHHRVHKLTVDQNSMKQILHAANYPELYSLSLIHFEEEILYEYLKNDSVLRDILMKQITHLNIDVKDEFDNCSEVAFTIFQLIISLCKKLTVLNFGDMFLTRKYMTDAFDLAYQNDMCSTLIKLSINVECSLDCLPLLDGRFDSLSTLMINVSDIDEPVDLQLTKQLPKLKCFSLTAASFTCHYDSFIVPLLRGMINLEELKLYVRVIKYDSTYIDGIQLYDQFLIYMKQLTKFTFDIKTKVVNKNINIELPSNEDIQRSFIGRGYQQVYSFVHTYTSKEYGKCDIYSLPYDFEFYFGLDRAFQGGIFPKVQQLKMNDNNRFGRKLFQRVSQDFPFLKYLYISNTHAMKKKRNSFPLITFPYLTLLDLRDAHVDYASLFLLKKNTHLPRLLSLCVEYKSLKEITNDFTNVAWSYNFGKLKSLDVCRCRRFDRPKNFHEYFPLL